MAAHTLILNEKRKISFFVEKNEHLKEILGRRRSLLLSLLAENAVFESHSPSSPPPTTSREPHPSRFVDEIYREWGCSMASLSSSSWEVAITGFVLSPLNPDSSEIKVKFST